MLDDSAESARDSSTSLALVLLFQVQITTVPTTIDPTLILKLDRRLKSLFLDVIDSRHHLLQWARTAQRVIVLEGSMSCRLLCHSAQIIGNTDSLKELGKSPGL